MSGKTPKSSVDRKVAPIEYASPMVPVAALAPAKPKNTRLVMTARIET